MFFRAKSLCLNNLGRILPLAYREGKREGGREGERERDRQTERDFIRKQLLQRRHLESRTEDGLVGNHAGGGAVLVPQTFKRRAANLRLAHPG